MPKDDLYLLNELLLTLAEQPETDGKLRDHIGHVRFFVWSLVDRINEDKRQ